jgi:hypothetical protein
MTASPEQDFVDPPLAVDPLPRCCPTHANWPDLVQHLVDCFPDVTVGDIVREVGLAKQATQAAGLSQQEALATGELIARHQLMLIAGRLPDAARLDPERHLRVRH